MADDQRMQIGRDPRQHVALPIDLWEAMVRCVGQIPTVYGHHIMKLMELARMVTIDPNMEPSNAVPQAEHRDADPLRSDPGD